MNYTDITGKPERKNDSGTLKEALIIAQGKLLIYTYIKREIINKGDTDFYEWFPWIKERINETVKEKLMIEYAMNSEKAKFKPRKGTIYHKDYTPF